MLRGCATGQPTIAVILCVFLRSYVHFVGVRQPTLTVAVSARVGKNTVEFHLGCAVYVWNNRTVPW